MSKLDLIDPDTLDTGGRKFWDDVTTDYPDLTSPQVRNLYEVCRIMDRLDAIDHGLGDMSSLLEVVELGEGRGTFEVTVDKAATTAKGLADLQAKLLASLRLGLPATNGAGNWGGARGPQKPPESDAKSAAELRAQMRSVK